MFGQIRPAVKNVLTLANEWKRLQTHTIDNLGTTPTSAITLRNATPAQTGAQQVSPSFIRQGEGFKTSGTPGTQTIAFREYALPIQGTTSPDAVWKFQSSINNAAYSDLMDLYTRNPDGNPGARMDFAGAVKLNFTHSNQDPNTSRVIDFNNSSGSYSNLAWTFGGTIKSAITLGSTGDFTFKAVNTGSYYFNFGSTITSTNLMVQIYSGGIYNSGGSFNQGKVTAGQADTTPPAYLNTYGSFAAKYTYSEASTVTINENSTLYYFNPIAEICTGTPNACSTYTGAGEATCNSHSTVGCSWVAEVTGLCSTANNTDSSTCTSLNAACSWSTGTCATYNNDSSGCTSAGFPSPPYCTFTPAVCADFSATEAGCNAASGCAADLFDCTTLSDGGGDGTNCATHPLCSYDSGTGVCSGNVYEGSCSGSYSGGDGVCSGSDFDTGVCAGTWVITPAACTGTALCTNMSVGSCTSESGCSVTSGITATLPLSSAANDGGTSRLYTFVHVGDAGTATINPNTGSTIMQYPSLKLYKKGDRVSVQNVITTGQCSSILSESPCNAQSPCAWQAAIVCSSFGDESACNSSPSANCTWDSGTNTCSGAGSPAQCTGGSYTSADMWVPHNYERSKNYVTKTAAYTATNEDDIINYTSGTVALTLPLSADIVPLRPLYLKNSGAGTITLNTTSSQLIDGNASGTLTLTAGQEKQVFPLAAGWIILGV